MITYALIVSCILAKTDDLFGIPIPGASFEPTKKVHGIFTNQLESSQQSDFITAEFNWISNKLAVNVGNFEQIRNVQCTAQSLTLTFQEVSSAANAYDAWVDIPDLAFIIGQEWDSCNGESIALYIANGISQKGRTIELKTIATDPKDVLEEFQVDISKYSPSEAGIDRELAVFPLNLNYDIATNSITNPNIKLAGNDYVQASCVNCNVRGEAKLRVQLTGTLLQVNTWSIILGGGIDGNADFKVGLIQSAKKQVFSANLFSHNFNPISINGLLTFSPKFSVDAAITFEAPAEISVTTGFNVNYPFDFKVYSDNGINGKPKVAVNSKPTMTPHMPTLSKGSIVVGANLVPSISVDAKVLNAELNVKLAFDNSLEMNGTTATKCAAEIINISLFNQHDFEVSASGLDRSGEWLLWTSGKNKLGCAFCDKCPA